MCILEEDEMVLKERQKIKKLQLLIAEMSAKN